MMMGKHYLRLVAPHAWEFLMIPQQPELLELQMGNFRLVMRCYHRNRKKTDFPHRHHPASLLAKVEVLQQVSHPDAA